MNTKKIISLLLAAVLVVMSLVSLASCGKKSAEDDTTEAQTTQTKIETVPDTTEDTTVLDVGDGTAGKVYVDVFCDDNVESSVREERSILAGISYSFNADETVIDALKAVLKANNMLLVETDGYVTAIDGTATGDAGDTSGWMFTVDGAMATVGAAECKLTDGSIIQWFYTADYNLYF